MFAAGGAAGLSPIPQGNMGLPNLPEGVRNNMGYMAMGGSVPPMMPPAQGMIPPPAQGIMSAAPPQMMPRPMANGGSPMIPPPEMMAAPMPPPEVMAQEGAQRMDPNALAGMIEGAEASGFSDPEQAGSFEEMMNSVSGDTKSPEERRTDLASIVGPEDAGQTPESVLALVTPVVELALVDQGIGPMAQEQMNTPVEGDMGGGIMTMAANGNMGVGNEPPVNFNLGGEVRRRGDEDPVPVFMKGGPVQYMEPGGPVKPFTPDLNYQQKVGETAEALLPAFQKFMPTQSAEDRKDALQSDILFDIANTALAFASPMQGEKEGMSAAERLAMATQQTKLLPTISARAAASRKEAATSDQAAKTAALQGSIGLETARLENVSKQQQLVTKGSIDLAKTAKEIAGKKAAATSAFGYDKTLQNQKYGLIEGIDKLKYSENKKDIELKAKMEESLKFVDEAIDNNQSLIAHERDVEKLNLTNLNNLEQIRDKGTIDKFIANEKNIVNKKIADNEVAVKRGQLLLNKTIEKNNVIQEKVENNQASKRILLETRDRDLNTLTQLQKNANEKLKIAIEAKDVDSQITARAEKTVIDQRLNEIRTDEVDLKKLQSTRDQLVALKKVAIEERNASVNEAQQALAEKKLEELDKELLKVRQDETQIKSRDQARLATKDKNENLYNQEKLKLDEEKNQITRANNVANQKLEREKNTLESHKIGLEMFGKGDKGKSLSYMTIKFPDYANGSEDPRMEASIVEYTQGYETIKGEKVKNKLPPFMKKAIIKRLEQGLESPVPLENLGLNNVQMDKYGTPNEEPKELTSIINGDVDLSQATGVLSSVARIGRWASGQASEFNFGEGNWFQETSVGGKQLNALAQVTERMIREAVNGRMDVQSLNRLQAELVRPSGTLTDRNALDQLRVTRDLIRKSRDEVNNIMENIGSFRDVDVTKARKTQMLTRSLDKEYSKAIENFEKNLGVTSDESNVSKADNFFKDLFNKRKTK